MTSERRAQIVVVTLTVAAICGYGKTVEEWTPPMVFGVVEAGAIALIAGMSKSPREGAQSDKATGEAEGSTVETTSTTETVEKIESAAPAPPETEVKLKPIGAPS